MRLTPKSLTDVGRMLTSLRELLRGGEPMSSTDVGDRLVGFTDLGDVAILKRLIYDKKQS